MLVSVCMRVRRVGWGRGVLVKEVNLEDGCSGPWRQRGQLLLLVQLVQLPQRGLLLPGLLLLETLLMMELHVKSGDGYLGSHTAVQWLVEHMR
jgi:hypothetical protein